ncbi:MAG: DUF1441 family protein [Shewanella sp.]|nr:DUF1441 family protein [Shewanella sp.]
MGNITQIADANAWNITRIAEAFNLSRDTVRKRLREAGVRPSGKRGGTPIYALVDVGPALFATETRTDIPDIQNPDKMPPKARKEWFESENARVKLMKDTRELIPESEHRLDLYQAFSAMVSFFENLPDKMERTGLFTPEQLELLEAQGDAYRGQLYLLVKEVEPDGGD